MEGWREAGLDVEGLFKESDGIDVRIQAHAARLREGE